MSAKSEKEPMKTFGLSLPNEALKKIKKRAVDLEITPSQLILNVLCEWWGPEGYKDDKGPLITKVNGATNGVSAEEKLEVSDGD